MDYRRGTVWVPRVLINTHVARRLDAFSFVSVTASAVISLEHLRPARPHFICIALSFSREAAGLSGHRLFFVGEKMSNRLLRLTSPSLSSLTISISVATVIQQPLCAAVGDIAIHRGAAIFGLDSIWEVPNGIICVVK